MKKHKKYRLKKGRIIVCLIVLVSITTLLFNIGNITNYINLKSLHYSDLAFDKIRKDNIDINVYSKTLDNIISTDYFISEYLDDYLKIEYNSDEHFFENINSLLKKGYNYSLINEIYKFVSIDNIKVIIDNDYNNKLHDILNDSYFKEENLDRYLKYNKDNIVMNVNMNLDYDFYTHDIPVENIDNYMIVNKYYKLSEDFVPELVKIDSKYAINNNQLMTKDAKEAFEKMCIDARNDNIYLYSGSAYRSYSYQNNLYNNRVKSEGLEYANKSAAKAGYSEHQTGLALDVLNGNFEYLSDTDKEFKWLIDNSYKYGFILRYPKDKENITGYMYEPWHFRYLTVEVASIIKEKDITYEEYIGMKK